MSDLEAELLEQLRLRLEDLALGQDLAEDEKRARWRENRWPMADFENAAGRLHDEQGGTMLEDLEPLTERHPDDDHDRDRRDNANAAKVTCKVEGCENAIAAKLGPYGGLCEEHAEERKAARRRRDQAAKAIEAREEPNPAPAPAPNEQALAEMRDLLRDIVLLDDSDLDLDQIRLEAARILLR